MLCVTEDGLDRWLIASKQGWLAIGSPHQQGQTGEAQRLFFILRMPKMMAYFKT